MSTYLNAYTLIEDIRRGVNEFSDAYVQGTDTTGIYSNAHLTRCLNRSQRYMYAIQMNYIPGEFLTSTSLTGVNSVYTLPWDFGSLREFKDENGRKVFKSSISAIPTTGAVGSKRYYYRKGNTLVLNRSGITDTYTLYYFTKPRDLHHSQGGSNCAATALHMDTTDAKTIDDYYNGMTVENRTQDLTEAITDYTGSTKIAVVASTPADDDWYGLVPEIPEIFHHLIAPRAIMIAKAEHPVAPKPPNKDEIEMWRNEVRDALIAFGYDSDITPEDIWLGFGSGAGMGDTIPGQGYTIY